MKKNNLSIIFTVLLVSSFATVVLVLDSSNKNVAVLAQTPSSSLNSTNTTPNNTTPFISEGNSTYSGTGSITSETNDKDVSTTILIPNPKSSSSDPTQKDSSNLTTASNATQRGEYKVDSNGVHYYDINNCSLVKGSSGIGDLSECEDAERVIKKEQRG